MSLQSGAGRRCTVGNPEIGSTLDSRPEPTAPDPVAGPPEAICGQAMALWTTRLTAERDSFAGRCAARLARREDTAQNPGSARRLPRPGRVTDDLQFVKTTRRDLAASR